ncbi:hypothetical protein OURE66S_04283 [Oligella ureolytica]
MPYLLMAAIELILGTIIDYVLDPEGNEIMRTQPQKAGDEANRVLRADRLLDNQRR